MVGRIGKQRLNHFPVALRLKCNQFKAFARRTEVRLEVSYPRVTHGDFSDEYAATARGPRLSFDRRGDYRPTSSTRPSWAPSFISLAPHVCNRSLAGHFGSDTIAFRIHPTVSNDGWVLSNDGSGLFPYFFAFRFSA